MQESLSLLTIHAHPDDESSKGAGTVAKYHSQGVRTTLVCCTGGEEGDILNPAMENPTVRDNLEQVRLEELKKATETIGYDEVAMLGYRDSGMPESEANKNPNCFAKAPLDEAVGKLVEVIRRVRPQVIVTYDENQQGYPHPDHLRVHEITIPAFEAAGDPHAYPHLGEPYRPLKLYYILWSKTRILALHEKFLSLGIDSPFTEERLSYPSRDHLITTKVDISQFEEVRRQALLAHETQIDPTSVFWFGLPLEEAKKIYPYDEYILAKSLVGASNQEDDLFEGVRDAIYS